MRLGIADVTASRIDRLCSELDLAQVWVDTSDAETTPELIRSWAEAFDFPEDCDLDWNAVDECLGDYDVSPTSGLIIVWTGWESVEADDDHVMAAAVDALRTAVTTWTDDGRPWVALVAGDGPSWDLPWAGSGQAPWEAEADDEDDDEDGVDLTDSVF